MDVGRNWREGMSRARRGVETKSGGSVEKRRRCRWSLSTWMSWRVGGWRKRKVSAVWGGREKKGTMGSERRTSLEAFVVVEERSGEGASEVDGKDDDDEEEGVRRMSPHLQKGGGTGG